MPIYRKKPIEIEAYEITHWNVSSLAAWCGGQAVSGRQSLALDIPTLEGTMRGNLGDYLIRGIHGEFYPCAKAIFEQTYEYVKEAYD